MESLKQWVPAEELKPGMKLLGSSGHIVPITQVHVRHLFADEKTYNFFVADTHTYFVGKHSWLVHNGDDTVKQGYPVKPQYPPATKVGENFQFNFDTSPKMRNSRTAGVARAEAQGTEIVGEGHHINSVQSHPHLAAEPDNIESTDSQQDHRVNKHGGNTRNATSGSLNSPKC